MRRGKQVAVPLNAEAAVLIRKQLGKHPTHVFCYNVGPVKKVSTKTWYRAMERAGIEDFRWHELATYLRKRIHGTNTAQR
jgi:integrase